MRNSINGNTKSYFSPTLYTRQLSLNPHCDENRIKRATYIGLIIFIAVSLLMSQIVIGTLQSSVSINVSGTIENNIPGNLIFSSGFEDSRDRGTSGEGDYALTIYNQVTDARAHTYMYPSGNYWWIEGKETRPSGATAIPAHSGSYCLGMNRNGGNRAEFQLRDWGWDSYDEWYFSMWLYFPSNWDTTPATSSGAEVMFAFGDSIYHQTGGTTDGGFPYVDIEIWRASTPTYSLALCGYDFNNRGHFYDTHANFPLPKGRWSHWEIYFDRGEVDAANGSAWVKVDGVEYLRSMGNIYAKWSGGYQPAGGKTLEIYPQDLYASGSGIEFRYLDDLQIWNGVPT
jgi:hypothetical protein